MLKSLSVEGDKLDILDLFDSVVLFLLSIVFVSYCLIDMITLLVQGFALFEHIWTIMLSLLRYRRDNCPITLNDPYLTYLVIFVNSALYCVIVLFCSF